MVFIRHDVPHLPHRQLVDLHTVVSFGRHFGRRGRRRRLAGRARRGQMIDQPIHPGIAGATLIRESRERIADAGLLESLALFAIHVVVAINNRH